MNLAAAPLPPFGAPGGGGGVGHGATAMSEHSPQRATDGSRAVWLREGVQRACLQTHSCGADDRAQGGPAEGGVLAT